MKFINKVTVTGADNSNKYEDLLALFHEYPFVEFGILLGREYAGRGTRFPSTGWLNGLNDFQENNYLPLAGHLCGSWVREVLLGKLDAMELYPWGSMFDRFQINTHAVLHDFDAVAIEKMIWLAESTAKEIIFQYDDVNVDMIDWALTKSANTSALFDLSHGAGVLPSEWPTPIEGSHCGYAGGLSPNNVAEQVEKIAPLIPEGVSIWIDAETKLRSDFDRVFDLDKVEQFLINTKPYVIGEE